MSRSADGTVPDDWCWQQPDGSRPRRPERIRRAAEQLGTVLQSVDLEEDAQLADELIEAIRAADRAYELETAVPGSGPEADGFRFPASRADGRLPRDR
jgi:hypothetical protein